jgi:regulator of protease activity HflC (stomatin/prohibitin superfamily)
MTKDNVTVLIDSVLYWHIIDPYQAQFGVRDVKKALIER